MACKLLFLGLLVAVGVVTADNLWPVNRELTYDYKADVQVGTVEQAHFASEYTIFGKLHIQTGSEEVFVKLDDVKYKLYNGELPQKQKNSPLPAPEEVSSLTSPFRIQYKDGKVKKFYTEVTDPQWVVNIKKGLAALLQLDLTKRLRMDVPSAFYGDEDTIFGNCEVSYSFIGSGEYNTITKNVNLKDCRGFPFKTWGDENDFIYGDESPYSTQYVRTYRIRLGNEPVFTDINSHFHAAILPYRARSSVTYANVNQTATLVSNVAVEKHLVLAAEREVQDLTYSFPVQDSAQGVGLDWSQGRVTVNASNLIPKALSLLDQIIDYLEENHVNIEAPNIKESSAVAHLISQVLVRFNVDELLGLHSQLSLKTAKRDNIKRDTFVKLLPQVGTHAAALAVRNLIRKHKVKTLVAQNLLKDLPSGIHNPTEKLLQELEDLITLSSNYSEEVQHAALLSFATLVYKASKTDQNAEFLKKYAEIYLKKAVEAKHDYAIQLVYLVGLFNIQVGKAAVFTETLLAEEDNLPRHIKHLVLWGAASNIYNFKKAYRLYWPVLVNPELHLQLRASALVILLHSARSEEQFNTIRLYMATQRTKIHLYKIYYELLRAKSQYDKESQFYASRVLRFSEPPLVDHFGTNLEIYNLVDKKYGFGNRMSYYTIADEVTGFPSCFYAEFEDIANGQTQASSSVYFKVEGLEQLLWGYFNEENLESTKSPAKVDMLGFLRKSQILSADDLVHKVSTLKGKTQKPIHIELIIHKNRRAIYTLFLNNTLLDHALNKELPQKIKDLQNLLTNFNSYSVKSEPASSLAFPTDLGIPLIKESIAPSILASTGNTITTNGLQFDAIFRSWTFRENIFSILNPIAGTWHGVYKTVSQDTQLPVHIGLQYSENYLKLVIGRPQGSELLNGTIGTRWFQQIHTYVYEEEGNKNHLGASCANCDAVTPVNKGNKNLKEVVFANFKIPGTGLVADFRIFNCEQDVTIRSLKKFLARVFDDDQINVHGHLGVQVLRLNHLLSYSQNAPLVGQCGSAVRLIPDLDIGQGSKIEVSVKITGGEIPGGNIVLPGVKLKIVGHWILRGDNGDAIEKTNVRTDIITSSGKENTDISVQLSRYLHDKPSIKSCWLLSKKFPARGPDALAFGWGNEEVITNIVISAGSFVEDSDGHCPSDQASINVNIKGEISDEQKKRAQSDDWPYGQCKEDKQKPEWEGYNFVPNTQACYQGSIILTSARKVIYSLSYSKLPRAIQDILQLIEESYRTKYASYFIPIVGSEPVELGTAEFVTEYSISKPTVDITVKTPTKHYQYFDVPVGSLVDDYNPILDNTHYSRFHLLTEIYGITKPCFISPENVYTADNTTVPHKQTSDYILVAGFSDDPNKFSAFVKSQGGAKPLILKLVSDGVTLEVSRDGATINGQSVDVSKGVQYPADDPNYAIRAWKLGDLVMAYSRRTGVFALHTGGAVDVEQPIINRGRTSGLCGNLNGNPFDDQI